MEVARYCTADGTTRIIEYDGGALTVDGHTVRLEDVLAWDIAGLLAWVSPETRAWAHALATPTPTPEVGMESAGASDSAPQSAREALLTDIRGILAAQGGYNVTTGSNTDLAVDNRVADASWGTGNVKVEYEAIMKADEAERMLYFWEIVKEQRSGLSFGSVGGESSTTFGAKRWGFTTEKVVGPGGVVANYSWDYGKTRTLIEEVCTRHGFRMKVVLRKGSAQY